MTMQIKDRLLYKGEDLSLNLFLLEGLFISFPEKKNFKKQFCSALWRGYVATFEIINNELFVKEVNLLTGFDSIAKEFKFNSILNSILPESKKVSWFSGLIRIDSNRHSFLEDNPDVIYKYLYFSNGNLIENLEFNYLELKKIKENQFSRLKQSTYYLELFKETKLDNPLWSDSKIENWISDNIIRHLREID